MAIDPGAVGATTQPQVFEWTDRDTLLYALGVGAGIDDLAFTTENSHDVPQQVLPTYAVICCPAFGAAGKVGTFNWAMLLHGSQSVRSDNPALVSIGSSERHPRFDLQMVGHLRWFALGHTPAPVSSGVLHGRNPRAQEIGAQADNHFSLIETVARHHLQSMRLSVSYPNS